MTNLAEQITAVPDPANHVDVTGVVVSAAVRFEDAEIADLLGQVPEGRRAEFFIRGARSGLIAMGNDVTGRLREAMRFMQTTLDTQVGIFGERMAEKVRDQLGDGDRDGHVQQRLQQILETTKSQLRAEMEKTLPEVFDQQTKRSSAFIQTEGERVMKQIAALFAENGIAFNVIHEARRDFAQRMEEVKVAVAVAQTKAANPTPRDAGLDYELWVHDQLKTIGTHRGDDVEYTAGKAGRINRCLKGDTRIFVAAEGVEVTEPPCVAVEIRDREESEFSLADVETMKENREAQVALVVAAHLGSLPRQCSDRGFAVSRRKRLVTVMLDPDSTESVMVLSAAYDLAAAMAVESVRQSRDGDWDAVARKADEIEAAVEGIVEARTALGQIEKKARDAGTTADKRYALLVRLLADLRAVVQSQ
jgi:hypothetical protein